MNLENIPYIFSTPEPTEHDGCVEVGRSDTLYYYDCVLIAGLLEEHHTDFAILGSGPDRYTALIDTEHAAYVLRAKIQREEEDEEGFPETVTLYIPQGTILEDDIVEEMNLVPHRWFGE